MYYKKTKIGNHLIETIDESITDIEDEFGNSSIFLTKKYYDFVSLLVTSFFKKKVENNQEHSCFMSIMKTIYRKKSFTKLKENKPYQWALRIINDSKQVDNLSNYLNANKIESFIKLKK